MFVHNILVAAINELGTGVPILIPITISDGVR